MFKPTSTLPATLIIQQNLTKKILAITKFSVNIFQPFSDICIKYTFIFPCRYIPALADVNENRRQPQSLYLATTAVPQLRP